MTEKVSLQGIWTQYGHQRLAEALATGEPLRITHAAIGDGGGSIPEVRPSQTTLMAEVWRGLVNGITQNPDDATDVVVDTVIPLSIGGFWVREWGLYDETGGLVAVGPHDEFHKPVIDSGQAVEMLLRIHLPVSDAASIVLTIDTQALATQRYVAGKIEEHDNNPEAHSGLLNSLTKYALKTTKINAGDGLTGGGRLDKDRTISADIATPEDIEAAARAKMVDAEGLMSALDRLIPGAASAAETQIGDIANKWVSPAALASFPGLHEENGYQMLPGGLIIQWCSGGPDAVERTQTIVFPIAFPTRCLKAFVSTSADRAAIDANREYQIISVTSESIELYNQWHTGGTSFGTPTTPHLFLIGY